MPRVTGPARVRTAAAGIRGWIPAVRDGGGEGRAAPAAVPVGASTPHPIPSRCGLTLRAPRRQCPVAPSRAWRGSRKAAASAATKAAAAMSAVHQVASTVPPSAAQEKKAVPRTATPTEPPSC